MDPISVVLTTDFMTNVRFSYSCYGSFQLRSCSVCTTGSSFSVEGSSSDRDRVQGVGKETFQY